MRNGQAQSHGDRGEKFRYGDVKQVPHPTHEDFPRTAKLTIPTALAIGDWDYYVAGRDWTRLDATGRDWTRLDVAGRSWWPVMECRPSAGGRLVECKCRSLSAGGSKTGGSKTDRNVSYETISTGEEQRGATKSSMSLFTELLVFPTAMQVTLPWSHLVISLFLQRACEPQTIGPKAARGLEDTRQRV